MSQFTAKQIAKVLNKRGAVCIRQKGSHATWVAGNCKATVAAHTGDVPKGTVAAIIKAFEPEFGKGWLK